MVLLGGPLGITLAPLLKSSSAGLYKALRPLANAYAKAAGHRQVGLRYDDLIWEEQDDVQKAISRLPNSETYDRVFRQKQAIQQSILHRDLPKDQWLKAEEDVRYLTPKIEQVLKETKEREDWDSITVERRR